MSTIAKIDGIAIASIAKIDSIAKASIAKIDGITLTPPITWYSPVAVAACGYTGSYSPTNTIDGNLGTRWKHLYSHEHWIKYDMNSIKTWTKIRVYAGSPTSAGNLCGISAIYINNTADESGGSKGSGATGSGWTEINVVNTSGRYIYIKLQTYYAPSGCSNVYYLDDFYEFEATNE